MAGWWRVEFHCHTCYSPDSLVSPRTLVRRARELGLDRLVITDHNTIRGALAARELAPDLVIVGEEVWTTAGEFIAFFVEEEVPAGLPPEEALARLRAQGAVVGISHPFDALRGSAMGREATLRFVDAVDALEVFNARTHRPEWDAAALRLATERGLGRFGGSDAHTLWELGRVVTWVPPFHDAASLRVALRQARVEGRRSPVWAHVASSAAKLIKRVGWWAWSSPCSLPWARPRPTPASCGWQTGTSGSRGAWC